MLRTGRDAVPKRLLLCFATAACLLAMVIPTQAKVEQGAPIKDLHYGEVLFYFFKSDYFSAITRLRAAQLQEQVQNHDQEAELLLGGLFLSYGQHREAAQIFERLLDGNVEDSVRDRAWFFLAKVLYQRTYYKEAENALSQIKGELPRDMDTERQMLHAQIYMFDERYDEAIALLDQWEGPEDWVGYAQFNLGVALVRLGRLEEGARMLEQVGTIEAETEETRALRDKANLALGYAYIQGEQTELAKPILQRVRLEGPFSNKALLGVGWADAEAERYRQALVPWMELRSRDLLDPAVQESLLAIPYALGKLDANRQAADHYVNAIEAFNEEINRIDVAIDTIRRGNMLDVLMSNDVPDELGWFWYLERLPDSPVNHYLFHLLATHEFQEALKNYRDLKFLQGNLDRWDESMVAFQDMLDTRDTAYQQRLPMIEESLGKFDLDTMMEKRLEYESRLNSIDKNEDFLGLATPKEQEIWGQLMEIEDKLASFPRDATLDEVREKHKLLKGVLLWKLTESYKARLWRDRKGIKDLDRSLKEAQRRHVLVERAQEEAPRRTLEFAGRIDALHPRLDSLQGRVDQALGAQDLYIQNIAVSELEAQKQRLDTYLVQARFALATIYDRSSSVEP